MPIFGRHPPGKIVAINKKANTLTIHESATKDVTYSVNRQTRVFVNRHKSAFGRLNARMKVSVTQPSGCTTLDYIDARTLVTTRRYR